MPTDIVLTLNRGLIRPLLALMNSIIQNSANPAQLRFNMAVPPNKEEVAYFEDMIAWAFPDRPVTWRVEGVELPPLNVAYLEGRFKKPHNPRGGQAMNYARFEVMRLFPDLQDYIYLDADIIVLDDVAKMLDIFRPDARLAAVRQPLPGIFYFRKLRVGWREGMQMMRPFNAGVYVSRGAHWGDDMTAALEDIIRWDKSHDFELFHLHTEPLMNLLFKDYQRLPGGWNHSGFGNHPIVAAALKRPLKNVSAIHWSGGHRKPWSDATTTHAQHWWAYDMGELPH